jgi:hypothetical protein
MPKDPDIDLRASGFWRLTSKGIAFIHGRIQVEDTVFVFDDQVLKYSKSFKNIKETLGKDFSYEELMRTRMIDD